MQVENAEPGSFKNCPAQITRTFKRTPHGTYFPLFARSVEHNETIDGLYMDAADETRTTQENQTPSQKTTLKRNPYEEDDEQE